MRQSATLPPGQYARSDFPRFGLSQFARRFPRTPGEISIEVRGDVAQPITVTAAFSQLPVTEQLSDFHCVTTWSRRDLRWSGVRFADFYSQLVKPQAQPEQAATIVLMRGQDGYAVSLPLDDLLDPSVLLATHLDGAPLSIAHGAPLRVVAPAHYGYKNPKHICAIEFWRDHRHERPAALRFMDHPRARVAHEERGRWVPGWMLRYLYRPLVGPTITRFRRALDHHQSPDRQSEGEKN